MTIEKLAEKANLSAAYMAAIERGEKWPRPATLERIAETLDVAASDLFSADNAVFYEVHTFAKELVKDFGIAVEKTIKKMNNAVNATKKS